MKRFFSKIIIGLIVLTSTSVSNAESLNMSFINGYVDGTFRPDGFISRAEGAKIIARVIRKEKVKSSFEDVPNDHWANEYIGMLEKNNILEGYKNKKFNPENNITRAEFSKLVDLIINRYYEGIKDFNDTKGHWARRFVGELHYWGLVNGYGNGYFFPENYITRAEAVKMLNEAIKFENPNIKYEQKANNFNDLNSNHWAYKYILEAIENN